MCRSEACPLPAATVLPADMPFPRPRAQLMKPKLPRKLANSARINLNKYWHALEELMPVSCRALDESDTNAINENLDNERRLAAMRLSEAQGVGSTGPSGSSGHIITPACNTSPLGKKSSATLKVSTSTSNILLDIQRSSSQTSELSLSPMHIEDSTDSSKAGRCCTTSKAEPACLFPSFSNNDRYPDENTPPFNGSSLSVTGGLSSR